MGGRMRAGCRCCTDLYIRIERDGDGEGAKRLVNLKCTPYIIRFSILFVKLRFSLSNLRSLYNPLHSIIDHGAITMVLVEEVPEDEILHDGERESDFETDSDASDVSSSFSDDDDDSSPADESIYDRIVALKDMIPPQTRSSVQSRITAAKDWTWWGVQGAGTLAWWVSTSALLVGLPLALAIEDETRVVQQEREMQMQSAGQQQVRVIASSGYHLPFPEAD